MRACIRQIHNERFHWEIMSSGLSETVDVVTDRDPPPARHVWWFCAPNNKSSTCKNQTELWNQVVQYEYTSKFEKPTPHYTKCISSKKKILIIWIVTWNGLSSNIWERVHKVGKKSGFVLHWTQRICGNARRIPTIVMRCCQMNI